jgi:hypothetical protein
VFALVGGLFVWRPGHGPARPAGLCALAVLLCPVQIVVGFTRTLIVHIPLGVALVALVIWIGVAAWRMPLRSGAAAAAVPAAAPTPEWTVA